MRRGFVLVDQILDDGSLISGYDESLSVSEIFTLVSRYFPDIEKCHKDSKIYIGTYKNQKYAIRCKNITYLGNPHPIYKKRIQISKDLVDFYKISKEVGAKPLLMGLYTYRNNVIFVEFGIETYIMKKAHNSSAHVYSSDIVAAVEDGYFQKIDFFKNRITVFRCDYVNSFLDEFLLGDDAAFDIDDEQSIDEISNVSQLSENKRIRIKSPDLCSYDKSNIMSDVLKEFESKAKTMSDKIIPHIWRFFLSQGKEWNGIDCYKKMIANDFRNKYQPEWAGFYLEYEFEQFIQNNKLHDLIVYVQDKTKGGKDLDLFFPPINTYGDLKTHSKNARGIPGNDWDTILGLIGQETLANHVYYIVCEHTTKRDSEFDYEVTKFWNMEQNKENIMSYHKKMKHDVTISTIYVLDINYYNKNYLTMFKQGINSNGKPRAPKIMIEQDKLKYFLVDKISL